jgi:DNA-binding transcriptional ArsR family regulator
MATIEDVKGILQKSTDDGCVVPEGGRRIVRDVDALRALAHPDRLAILLFLLAAPTRTATECAAEIGVSPSACSYHLRELERFGYVERADAQGDARTRPWRASAVGFTLGGDWEDDSPDARAARYAIGRAELAANHRLIERFVDAADDLDPAWQAASDFSTFELTVTPDELTELNEQVAALLRPFRTPVREHAPDAAAAIHVVYQAFPRLGP